MGADVGREIRELKDQMSSVNYKLGKVMEALKIKPDKPSKPKEVKVTEKQFQKALEEVAVAEVDKELTKIEIPELVKKPKTAKAKVATKAKAKKAPAKKKAKV